MRKFEAINLMKLYAMGSTNGWNQQLTDCLNKHDINRLVRIKYGIQAGMDDLVKQKLNTDEINIWFCRLVKSIEITAKRIIKLRHPLPIDNPLIAKDFSNVSVIKKQRDKELYDFLRRSAY